MKISIYYSMFHLIIIIVLFSSSLTYSSLAQTNIVKTLPGYPGDLPFTLETGYVKVGDEEQIELFYYFIESERDVENDPLMLWLSGGPECSSLSGLLLEIGPFQFNFSATDSDIPKLQQNPYSWTKVASIIFVDSPVGVGFSYATSPEAYYGSNTLEAIHLHEFLRNWLNSHSNFAKNHLYVSGDSYSGMVIPIVVQEILKGNEIELSPKLNFKGYILGNPLTTQGEDSGRYDYAHKISLLSDELYESAMINCNGDFNNVSTNNVKCSKNIQAMVQDIRCVNYQQVLERACACRDSSAEPSLHNALNKGGYCRNQTDTLLADSWANNDLVREALHIKKGSKDHWTRCDSSLTSTYYEVSANNTIEYHINASRNSLQVLIYSGDQDILVPYIGTLQWINKLNIPISDEWRPWFVDGQVAGYVTEFSGLSSYRLVFTTIKGGGHTAPEYMPRECLVMIDKWLSLTSL